MRLSEIESRAKAKGVAETWKYSRKQLISLIQKSEGNILCFATGRRECDQLACCWREDCLR